MEIEKLIMANMDDMGLIAEKPYTNEDMFWHPFLTNFEYQLAEELFPKGPTEQDVYYGEKLLVVPKEANGERIALYWYFRMNDGDIYDDLSEDSYVPMDEEYLADLIVITSEWKKKNGIWQREMIPFLLSTNRDCNYYDNRIVVDSWDHIVDYAFEKECYFIFDEYELPMSDYDGMEEVADSFFTIVDGGQMNRWIMMTNGRQHCGVFPAFSSPSELW